MNTQKIILLFFATLALTYILGQQLGVALLTPDEFFIGYTLIMTVMCAVYCISIPSTTIFVMSIGVTGIGVSIRGIFASLNAPAEIVDTLQLVLYVLPSTFPLMFMYHEFFAKGASTQAEQTST
jgi:hypothetical protein